MLKATLAVLLDDLLRRVKIAAVVHDTSLQQMLTEPLEPYLEKKELT